MFRLYSIVLRETGFDSTSLKNFVNHPLHYVCRYYRVYTAVHWSQ